jgi:DinB family protein
MEHAIAILERTPRTLGALLGELPAAWLDVDEGPGSFSPRDVVGHLIHGEDTDWIPRIRIVLAHGEAQPFTPFDRRGHRPRIQGRSMAELLREFEGKRRANLETLRGLDLTPERLERRGTHPELGPVTLGQLVAAWAVHDLNHLAQIERVMAGQYREAVGPWRAYMRILNPP